MLKDKIMIIIPLVVYLGIILFIAYSYSKKKKNSKDFIKEYYIGNRSLNGFVLAMTILSTYISASSFISGPAIVHKYGLSWILLACIQIPVIYLTLGVLGKKLAIIGRRINAVTVIDILKYRYKSKKLVFLVSIITLIFLIASTVAQFIGGARLLETILGIDYKIALTIFTVFVVCYTTLGGFKTVSITDTIQSIVMMIAIVVIFLVIYFKIGSMSEITKKVVEVNPNLITPNSGGEITKPFIMSFWLLVGITLLGIPSTTVRCMSFKDTKSMHKAMVYGSFVIGFILIGMHMIGYMSIALYPDLELGDKLIPYIAVNNLSKILVGVFIGGPLAAIMSSVDSILIVVSSTLIKDIYIGYIDKDISQEKVKKVSFITTLFIGVFVYILSINPISLIVWINLFALAGQELIYSLPILLGLFYRRANSFGVILMMISGIITFFALTIFKISIFGLNNLVPALTISIIFFAIFNRFGESIDKETEKIFFE